MMVGALGNIPFYVTSSESMMLSGLTWSSGARYAEHVRHAHTDMLEYVGDNPDQISFEVKLSAFLGVNPTRMIDSLRTLKNNHKAVKFTLGTLPVPGVWVLSDMEIGLEYFHKDGTLLSADVKVTLKEYIQTVQLPLITNKISFVDRMVGSGRITPTPSPADSSGSSRKPSVPPTSKSVAISPKPVTLTAAQAKAAVSSLKTKGALLAQDISTKVKFAFAPLANWSVVDTIKKAFTKPTVPAIIKTPAKPVVVKPSAAKKGLTR